jgi:hypothetical protein
MAGLRLRVFRLDIWQNPAFAERIGREAGIELVTAKLADPAARARAALATAHVYHASSAKDDLPQAWFVTEELLGLRLLSLHTVHVLVALMREARTALATGTFDGWSRAWLARYLSRTTVTSASNTP